MASEPKRLDSVEHIRYDEAEALMRELERRQLDRRKANRWKQISQWIAVVGFSLTLGSCATGIATRMGWRLMGTPDDVIKMQASITSIEARLTILEENHTTWTNQMQFLVVARCLELNDREQLLARGIVDCPTMLARAGVRP